jgi:hypothetical protein
MRPLNSSQKTAVQPLLDVLIARYSEVAETGETKRADPLCAEAGVGRCFACPVFGEEARADGHFTTRKTKDGGSTKSWIENSWHHCDETLPAPPQCVGDQHDGVFLSRGADRLIGKAKQTSREQARAFGAQMVAFFEGLRMNDEGGEP